MRRQLLVVLGVLAGTGIALAQRPGPPGGGPGPDAGRPEGGPGHMARLKQELGLSDAQVSQLQKLHSDQQKAGLRKRADLQVARIELRDLLGAATVDEKGVAAKVKELGDLQASVLRARVDGQLAFRKVLTPEQFEKFKSMRMDRPRGPRPDGPRPGMRRGPRRGPGGGPGVPGFDQDDDDQALTGPEGR